MKIVLRFGCAILISGRYSEILNLTLLSYIRLLTILAENSIRVFLPLRNVNRAAENIQ